MLYGRTGFNEEAKFGFRPMAVTKTASFVTIALYHGVGSYEEEAKVVRNFASRVKLFMLAWLYHERETREVELRLDETSSYLIV